MKRLPAIVVLALLISDANSTEGERRQNHLAGENSPYLLQHVENPVDWYPWGPAAFEEARKDNKPIFLSIGYSTCHWCHVMERESFENADIARILNEHFVCIKVDREERPDIDQLYLTALQTMGQPGGWPLSMFLTADGRPIVGGTYWPPADREVDGEVLPGLPTVLNAVISAWNNDRESLLKTAELRANQTRRALAMHQSLVQPVEPTRKLVEAAIVEITSMADPVYGGFGRSPEFSGPKFPQPGYLRLLQEARARTTRFPQQTVIEKMLREMACRGIFDQLGGGFHRYSTERTWMVPHFEKMLYDNAQLLEIYAIEHAHAPRQLYAEVIRQTAAFIQQELTSPEGVFWTAIDADSEGVEGRYYTWTDAELEQAFPDPQDRQNVRRFFSMDQPESAELEGLVLGRPMNLSAKEQATRERLRTRLLQLRQQRTYPHRDTKVLTAWNGLMIAGLARSGTVIPETDGLNRAIRAADFLWQHARDASGRLRHGVILSKQQPPRPHGPAFLDDYTHLTYGLLALHDATKEERWLKRAQHLTAEMIQQFYDLEHGGFFYTAGDQNSLFVRMKDQHDGAIPSGNSLATENLLRLAEHTGDQRYRSIARTTLQSFAGLMEASPTLMPVMTRALLRELSAPPPNDLEKP